MHGVVGEDAVGGVFGVVEDGGEVRAGGGARGEDSECACFCADYEGGYGGGEFDWVGGGD